jgi:hypothetical protein
MSATAPKPTRTSILRSSLLLAGCVGFVALLLAPFAMQGTGSAGFGGLAVAAAICLLAGLVAEFAAFLLGSNTSPLVTMLLGMGIRMTPPMGIVLAIAMQGASGRQYMAFICYLLAFYLATLALETWLTVSRVTHSSVSASPTVS